MSGSNEKRHIFIDIETTGLQPRFGHKIVEIACFYNEQDGSKKIFQSRVNPSRDIPQNIVEIHGINNEMVRHSPRFIQIGQELLDFIGDGVLVGHNIRKFDIPFINFELNEACLKKIDNELADTLEMFRKIFPGESASLDYVCQKFDIDLSERMTHGALIDAKLAAECFSRMTSF